MSLNGTHEPVTPENDLNLFFTLSPGLLCIADFDGYFKRLNPAWEKTLGFSNDELLGMPFVEFVHPEDRERTVDETRKLALGGETIFFKNRYRCRDGSYKWLLWQATPRIDRQQIYAVARDITELELTREALREASEQLEARVRERTAELAKANKTLANEVETRKAVEESLRQMNETLESIVTASPQAVIALDANLKIRLWNPAAERIFGWKAGDVMEEPLPFVPEEKQEEFRGLSQRVLAGELLANVEVRGLRRDGTPVDLLISAGPLRDNQGGVSGSVAVLADITEKKQLEQQFLRAQRMESLGILAGGIAHDLNNVLTPILMAVQLLVMKYPEVSDRKLLATLESSVKRGANLVRQVLTFARGVQSERITLSPKHPIQEVERMARETFPKTIDIMTDVPNDLWNISADPTQLHQVLMNLCVNALAAMPAGGVLNLSARNMMLDDSYASMNAEAKAGAYILMEVTDTGTGIPAEIIDKIFDPFFTTKEPGKGTGLGLSTVLAIVKAHGGFVNVYSEPGKGTKFTVYLPAVITAETQRSEERREVPLGHGELILVVDDEAAICDIARATLEAHQYRAITANDGAEAVALYAQHQNEIALVLSDSNMPVMDGVALARVLERINAAVKIVSMSGLRQNGKSVHGPAAVGVIKAFLPKPFTAEQLMRTLHEVLETS